MKKIVVMMSTYNGEKYLEEQLDSILNQEFQNDTAVHLYIRDDGSNDNTVDILKRYKKNNDNITLIIGEKNIGWKMSFMKLCQLVPNADYYAFADQDDVWLSNKLQRAIEIIGDNSFPSLYSCNAEMVDKRLKHIGLLKHERKYSLNKAIIKCTILGCTQVFNFELLNLIRKLDYEQNIPHDWWTLCVCLLNGKVYCDNHAYILYRQDNNELGGKQRLTKRIWRLLTQNHNIRNKIALELCRLYDCSNEEFIINIANYRKSILSKFKLIFSVTPCIGIKRIIFYKIYALFNKL